MRGGKASRQKGNRAERAIVKFLQDRGFAAERVPLSGAAGGTSGPPVPDENGTATEPVQ